MDGIYNSKKFNAILLIYYRILFFKKDNLLSAKQTLSDIIRFKPPLTILAAQMQAAYNII